MAGCIALHVEQLAGGLVLGESLAVAFSLSGIQFAQWKQCLFECLRFYRRRSPDDDAPLVGNDHPVIVLFRVDGLCGQIRCHKAGIAQP